MTKMNTQNLAHTILKQWETIHISVQF